jgi:hypothetical protein
MDREQVLGEGRWCGREQKDICAQLWKQEGGADRNQGLHLHGRSVMPMIGCQGFIRAGEQIRWVGERDRDGWRRWCSSVAPAILGSGKQNHLRGTTRIHSFVAETTTGCSSSIHVGWRLVCCMRNQPNWPLEIPSTSRIAMHRCFTVWQFSLYTEVSYTRNSSISCWHHQH